MSVITSILAPTTSDEKYIETLVKELTANNADETCGRISEVFKNNKDVPRQLFVPVIQKICAFVEQNNIEQATHVLLTFNRFEHVFFKTLDLAPLFKIISTNNNLYSTPLLPPFCGLCFKCINNNEDLFRLTSTPNIIADFVPYASNPFVISFIVKVAQIDTSLRVPLVFNGLIEQILPTVATNETHLELLSLLISNVQTRKYFIDMGHIPRLLDTLFQTNFSNLATNAFIALLYPKDLTNLFNAQDSVFNDGAFERFIEVAKNITADDESVKNVLKCINSCLFCHPLKNFDSNLLLDVAARRPSTRHYVLDVLETISMSNGRFLFQDGAVMEIEELFNDKMFFLFISYICYECHKSSKFDILGFVPQNRQEKILKSVICIQRRLFYEQAIVESQDASDELLRSLSCVLLLVCRKSDERRGILIQYSVSLFGKYQGEVRLPRSFLCWGAQEFCPSRIGYWMKRITPRIEMKNSEIFDLSPQKSAEEMRTLNYAANEAISENKRLKIHVKALLDDKEESEKAFVNLEKEIVAAKVVQLKKFTE
ncbi:hypothetical protein TVAG_462910 [Trichomonas vaginalis G3]|uniref:Uncharacterized protein n=1 Tax=Trichomonas vaginalis (strain ATCC PRA-98 / G3) TaxID=412133 RepID=A2DM02_TRIV3|nr:armadillo (ARM) repeat-containing protein family [Trichomonas vaginalis G3]EAY18605.1 hypothetical protein TVAG_462910 [Trichomonas vaginalis G3]KAI5491641.1 armadillo (ARM) repeat-containing protein family [Trichomonas vaginalis G3]|eukprot:XP_001579591.1 hypothetical protein [Trichomonas vaginalis G3]